MDMIVMACRAAALKPYLFMRQPQTVRQRRFDKDLASACVRDKGTYQRCRSRLVQLGIRAITHTYTSVCVEGAERLPPARPPAI